MLLFLQEYLRRRLGIWPPFLYGRGLFNTRFGLLPRQRPITMVVGAPLHVVRVPNPTREQVQDLHARYTQALINLFETHKADFGVAADRRLEIY